MSDAASPSVVLFPASFDPITNGHLDIVHRSCRIFDQVVVGVATNLEKRGTFSLEERLAMLDEVFGKAPGVRIVCFDGLVVNFATEIGARAIIRGLRAMSDFEYEFEMALMNRHLQPDTEILFMMASLNCVYVSSSRLKELARFGAAIDDFVPASVARRLREKLGP
jgi:pantetheine-phosphate adenylyltransferase